MKLTTFKDKVFHLEWCDIFIIFNTFSSKTKMILKAFHSKHRRSIVLLHSEYLLKNYISKNLIGSTFFLVP